MKNKRTAVILRNIIAI